ncbi:MAG: hypothetical protein DRO93_10235 [Candidatus Thorarchaeota archaeon]|nr:MAG: hypothetical protein DRO93_10235 [Candidatus Thorarchaeota archaeon]
MELYKDFEFGGGDLRRIEHEVRGAVKRSTCFLVEPENKVVSASMIVAETNRAGVLNYSRTLPAFRRRGLHRCIRTACYQYMFQQGKASVAAISESNTAALYRREVRGYHRRVGDCLFLPKASAETADSPALGAQVGA